MGINEFHLNVAELNIIIVIIKIIMVMAFPGIIFYSFPMALLHA